MTENNTEAVTNIAEPLEKNSHNLWLFAILFGLIGAAINSVPFPLLPEIQLILGNAAFVFVAMHLLPKYTLVTAFITLIPIYFIFGHPWGFLTFGLEAWFIASMRSKGWYVLLADMVYWLCIGMPLTFIIIWFQVTEFNSHDLFTVFKQAFNGLWYTSIACFIIFIIHEKFGIYWYQQSSSHRTLRVKLMYSLVFVTIAALFSATLLISNHFIKTSKKIVVKSLEDSGKSISNVIDIYIDNNSKTIDLAGKWLSGIEGKYYQSVLDKLTSSNRDFSKLIITNEQGELTMTSIDLKSTAILDYAEKDNVKHFTHTKVTDLNSAKLFDVNISPAFKLTSKDELPIVSLSSAFLAKKEQGSLYIVEGLLNLAILKELVTAKIGNLSVSTVIVDQDKNIVCASPEMNLKALEAFEYQIMPDKTHNLKITSLDKKRYIYQVNTTKNGWHVYTLIDQSASANNIKDEYLVIFIILFFTLIITVYFADQYGRRLTKPIHFMIEQLASNQAIEMPKKISASAEIIHLYEEIISNRNKLYDYQELLEEKVKDRTKELKEVNLKLEKLALYDGLTQVHNRRYLDDNFAMMQKSADRNTALMSLIMVDLDHFKKLNDSYGHLIGDNCLVKVAQLIKKAFDRGSDMVVRFGGEEFVIVAPYITPASLALKIEALKDEIEAQVFYASKEELFYVTASFGAVIADASYSEDVLQWIKEADDCLYQAKKAGRNCYRIKDKVTRVGEEE